MKMTTDFALLIRDFMTRYLVATRNVSQNTVLSYRDSYVLLLHCLNECYGLKPENLKVQDVSPDRVKSFLEWLEEKRGCSIRTRNLRLVAIHSLFRYIAVQQPEYLFQAQQILSIVISHFLFHGLTLLSIKLKEDTARRNLTHSLTDYSVQCLFMISLSMSQKRQQATTLAKSACCLTTTWLSPAMPCKTMILISVKDYNQFSQDYYESIINSLQFHQLTCTCGHSSCLSVHGYYTRGIILPDGKHFLRICRVKCSECGKTHALLLTSIVPYDRISLSDQHTIVCAFENGTDKYAVCEDNPSLDESNVRSVIRRYCLYWLQRLLAEKISLSAIPSLIRECLAAYSMQFMQIHRTEAVLFVCTT